MTGNQVNGLGSSIASSIGGGSVFDPVNGSISAPMIMVGGSSYGNITDAIQAGDTKADNANSGLAAALGGGASVAPDGTVTAPAYSVQGALHSDVGSAITAVDGELTDLGNAITGLTNGTSGLVQQAGGAPGTGEITVERQAAARASMLREPTATAISPE